MKKNKIIGVEETGSCFMTIKAYSLKKTINLEAECFQFCTVSFKTFREIQISEDLYHMAIHKCDPKKKKKIFVSINLVSKTDLIFSHLFYNWIGISSKQSRPPNIGDNLQIIGIPVQDKFSSCEISERKNQKASFDREASMICRIFTLRYSRTLMSHSF